MERCTFLLPVDILVTARTFVSLPLNAINFSTSGIMAIMRFIAASICWEFPPKASEN
jgi:hypothetical protein